MATLIKHRALTNDAWQTLNAEQGAGDSLAQTPLLVPLARWLAERAALIERGSDLGVLLEGSDDPAAIAQDLPRLKLVAINFPKFTDGRGYSIARLLRERHGYKGEIRAVGDVLRDQLQELERCGFNAFALRADQDVDAALKAFQDFSDAYQAHVLEPQPLFRRRAASNAI
jgi:uncharacterized protein (DUF934 family)